MLDARDFLTAMFTNLCPLFDNFGTKRAFTGKESFVDFLYGLIDRLLQEFISKPVQLQVEPLYHQEQFDVVLT